MVGEWVGEGERVSERVADRVVEWKRVEESIEPLVPHTAAVPRYRVLSCPLYFLLPAPHCPA